MAKKIIRKVKRNYLNLILEDNRVWLVITIIVLLGAIKIFTPIFIKKHELQLRKRNVDLEIRKLRKQEMFLAYEVMRLENDKVYIEQIAREQLGLARQGEIIYNIVPAQEAEKKSSVS